MIKNIFIDLDGTLLPMDNDSFTKSYFSLLGDNIQGREKMELIQAVKTGTYSMFKNNAEVTCEEVFWKTYESIFGEGSKADIKYFDKFYEEKFDGLKAVCGFDEKAKNFVDTLKNKGYKLVLSSNPVFPLIAQQKRLIWAGVDPNKFDYISSYENSCYCKPNLNFFKSLLDKLNLKAEETVLVGDNLKEDMVASSLGINCFLISEGSTEFSPSGNLDKALEYIESLK